MLALPPRDGATPAYLWLYAALREAILDGRLPAGAPLPATRELSNQYGLARGTVVNAFELLKSEGYAQARFGSGTYVSSVLPDDLLTIRKPSRSKETPVHHRTLKLSAFAKRLERLPPLEHRATHAFRVNLPAIDEFPTTLWSRISSRVLRHATTELLVGCEPLGYAPLRAAIADYLNASRGVKCVPEQIVVVSGVQEALEIVARLIVDPGDVVATEDPGYAGTEHVCRPIGAKVRAIPVDEHGLRVDAKRLRGCRMVYVTPAHQYPLGVTMSLARRLELLQWAETSNAVIFEDDYDSEYRYAGRPIPALQGLDRAGLVFFAGSFNKVLFPSLRLGYLVVPQALVDSVDALRSIAVRHPELPSQAILCDFINEGHFGRHLRRMRNVYAQRLHALRESAASHLAGALDISDVQAGLHTIAWLKNGMKAVDVARAAAARMVEVIPLSAHSREFAAPEGLQLGFGAVDEREIRRGVKDLAAALTLLERG
jgi:GntR family transcriptional regulator / MocR family aminotransferase